MPIMKLIGKFIVSPSIRLTFLLLELFCVPIMRIKNKEILNNAEKRTFLNNDILIIFLSFVHIINPILRDIIFFG